MLTVVLIVAIVGTAMLAPTVEPDRADAAETPHPSELEADEFEPDVLDEESDARRQRSVR